MTKTWGRWTGTASEPGDAMRFEDLDPFLVRLATVAGGALLANYLFWSVHTPIAMQFAAVAVLAAVPAYFVLRPPVARDWPIKLLLIGLAATSLGSPTAAWDARSIWLFHAKRIFVDDSLYAQLDGYAVWSHNDYPVLVPALAASLARVAGHWNEVFPKFSSILALAPALFLLAAPLRTNLQQVMLCCLLLFVCDSFLIDGYMDGLVAVWFTAAALLAGILTGPAATADSRGTERRRLLILAGIVFAALTLLKNEGVPALGALALAAALTKLVFPTTRSPATMAAVASIAIVPLLAWKIICATRGIDNDLTESNLVQQLAGRVYSVAAYREILLELAWRVTFLLPLALFLYAACRGRRRTSYCFVSLAALAYGAVLFVVYLATPLDLAFHLTTSAQRTVMPIALALGYCFVVFAEPLAARFDPDTGEIPRQLPG